MGAAGLRIRQRLRIRRLSGRTLTCLATRGCLDRRGCPTRRGCWAARVLGLARVSGGARVSDKARVAGYAWVSGEARGSVWSPPPEWGWMRFESGRGVSGAMGAGVGGFESPFKKTFGAAQQATRDGLAKKFGQAPTEGIKAPGGPGKKG